MAVSLVVLTGCLQPEVRLRGGAAFVSGQVLDARNSQPLRDAAGLHGLSLRLEALSGADPVEITVDREARIEQSAVRGRTFTREELEILPRR